MIDTHDLAYAAGMFDGEGTVHIQKQLTLAAMVASTTQSVCLWLQLTFGGNIYMDWDKVPNHKILYRWGVYGQEAAEFLELIRPDLKIKRQQVDLALEFQSKKRSGYRYSDAERALQEANRILMKQLNQRGV